MEAPDKIYLIRNFTAPTSLNTTNDHRGNYLQEWYKSREKDADVEYIRTDVFIEKACKWLKENVLFTHPRKGTKVCAVNLIAFMDAMKGE